MLNLWSLNGRVRIFLVFPWKDWWYHLKIRWKIQKSIFSCSLGWENTGNSFNGCECSREWDSSRWFSETKVVTLKLVRFLGKLIILEIVVLSLVLCSILAEALILAKANLLTSKNILFLNYLTTFSTYSIFSELFAFLLILLKQTSIISLCILFISAIICCKFE